MEKDEENKKNLPNPFYVKNDQENDKIIPESNITQIVLQKKDEINPESNITQIVLKDKYEPKMEKTIIAYKEKGYCPFSCIPILEKNDFSYYEDENMP